MLITKKKPKEDKTKNTSTEKREQTNKKDGLE